MRRSILSTPVVAVGAVLALSGGALALTTQDRPLGDHLVGTEHHGSTLTPMNQYVTPVGDVITRPGRPLATAISPDGTKAADLTTGGHGVVTVTDLVARKVVQTVVNPTGGSGDVSYGGITYSPDGKVLWAAQTRDLLRFGVNADGTLGAATVVPIPGAPPEVPTTGDFSGTNAAIPAGIAYTNGGQRLLVTLNGTNSLAVLDPATGAVLSQTPVGVAPRDVVVIGNKAYVANQGGRRAGPTDFVNPSYGTNVVSDTRDGRAITGTVSELDLAGPAPTVSQTFDVGLQPTALLAHGTDLLVTNSNDDSVSVIDTAQHRVGQTINVNPLPVKTYGASPNSLAFSGDGHLLVSLGRDNAIAEYTYAGPYSPAGFDGLIPTDWYPGTVLYDQPLGKVVVGNVKGVGSLGPVYTVDKGPGTQPATGHGVYSDIGSLQLLTPPATPAAMQQSTQKVFANNQWNSVAANNVASTKAAPRAIPVNIGDPSTIKHVYLVVKENRTYDQVLGDDPRGNGDPSLAQFGKLVTPNAHKLATQYPLIDNLYSDGTLSADGHNWLTQAFVNDYIEKSFGSFTRSYPASGADSLAYARSGFLWDNAARHNLKATSWGEYANYWTGPGNTQPQGTWQQWYHDSQVLEGKAAGQLHAPIGYYQTHSDVPGLEKILQHSFPNFQTQIPDQYRADLFQRDYARMSANGTLPSLGMLWVMDDHTAAVQPNFPTPRAQVADNDLAVGRIVDTISHSKDWASSAVFVIEDDSQNGVDHVDGHRNPVFVASPYAAGGGKVVHTYYSQLNVVRTIEQILGLPPMNQLDLAAKPMTDVFTDTPDTRPYNAVPNRIPLDEYPDSVPASAAAPRASAADPAAGNGIATPPEPGTFAAKAEAEWIAWGNRQDFRSEDRAPMGAFNREIWYASNGFTTPYPGDSRVLLPSEVPATTASTDGHPRVSPWTSAG